MQMFTPEIYREIRNRLWNPSSVTSLLKIEASITRTDVHTKYLYESTVK